MKLVKNVEEFLHKKADELSLKYVDWLVSELEEYENNDEGILSPVEQLFYIEYYSRYFIASDYECLPFHLWPQYQDKSTGKYRLDFNADFVSVLINSNAGNRYSEEAICKVDHPRLGIEIDGHIWHEKTKEQAQHDKKRERFLISKGWKILRFTGSEVYKDPAKCLDETIRIGESMAGSWYEEVKKFDKELKNG